ncbi:hypothetical protein DSO57_1013535 [Entomophthora muscae]|uniref:Uncharacterized protein n=1 Tax=Entomophthora muscae TaxID=34485 RepID=A0ACC2UR28_9FUNG|nr:hypothetical protein DSO57_1013535 [Entomophthora muscae]
MKSNLFNTFAIAAVSFNCIVAMHIARRSYTSALSSNAYSKQPSVDKETKPARDVVYDVVKAVPIYEMHITDNSISSTDNSLQHSPSPPPLAPSSDGNTPQGAYQEKTSPPIAPSSDAKSSSKETNNTTMESEVQTTKEEVRSSTSQKEHIKINSTSSNQKEHTDAASEGSSNTQNDQPIPSDEAAYTPSASPAPKNTETQPAKKKIKGNPKSKKNPAKVKYASSSYSSTGKY